MASSAISMNQAPQTAEGVFSSWLDQFNRALETLDPAEIGDCFLDDGYWKDFLAITWDFRTYSGKAEIRDELVPVIAQSGIRSLQVAQERTPPQFCRRSGRSVLEGLFDFETNLGRGTGVVRLVQQEPGEGRWGEAGQGPWKAWLLLTSMLELKGFEEKVGLRRPSGDQFSKNLVEGNWLDQRLAGVKSAGDHPPVVIVGAGHAGLILAARLKQMGVEALVIEKDDRIGDVWRKRYHSLTLHNQVFANHMPFLPFPKSWPVWIPKDKLANWLEFYAETLELNVWTSTALQSAAYDSDSQSWTIDIVRDGEAKSIVTPNLVLSTGVSGSIPKRPHIPGLENFKGEVIHSSEFTRGDRYAGKKVMVVGTGNSGHDIAQDLYVNGAAEVYMLQRGPTCVVSLEPTAVRTYAVYKEDTPVDDVDLLTSVLPFPILEDTYRWITSQSKIADAELIEALEAVGFRTYYGDTDTGFQMMYLRGEGGYYIDVGCSELIIKGAIKIVDYDETIGFDDGSVLMKDGSAIDCDAIILATGFMNMQENVRKFLGDEIADAVGPVWGLDEHCQQRNMYKPTAQPGLWFMGGALIDARLFSRFLAIRLVAELNGLTPDHALARTHSNKN
jgi:cation diffusion facilitator CzcD-associated flavoprotein CzcO